MLQSTNMPSSNHAANLLVGFIGQGYIGKNYADDFERRGYSVVRYSLEEPHVMNREKVSGCDVVFIAVPTPTTPAGFDGSIVRSAVELVGAGKVAIIKSTLVPGTTKSLQEQYADRVIFYSPEFLSEATAADDAANPFANIVGLQDSDPRHHAHAEIVHAILPPAPFTLTCDSTEAELIKYSHNVHGFMQVVLWNLMYDLTKKVGGDWETVRKALDADPYVSSTYLSPAHKNGRGAGGNCFIKDFAAIRGLYEDMVNDAAGIELLRALEKKNKALLRDSGKDLHLVRAVYGTEHDPA